MSPVLAALFAILLYLVVRLLHLTAPVSAPLIYAKDRSSQFVQSVLTLCPILHQPYVPPFLWGKSGHIQTILYAKMGRVNMPVPNGVRHSKIMSDGATLTFDLHEPLVPHKTGGSYCLLFCPGIGNNSESPYVRTLVDYAQKNGYIAVVLNHIGSLKTIQLTAPRIYSYGGTEELHIVRKEVQQLHPKCGIILVGCSMGANIVIKYLGENQAHQTGILAAVSINQGYDVMRAKPLLLSWRNLRRAYIYVMTRNQKNIIKCHKDVLLCDKVRCDYDIDVDKIFASRTMEQLDEAYTRRLHGFETLDDYYHHNSSGHYLQNIKTPLLVVNAEDDPIVPPQLLDCPKTAAEKLPYMIFALTKHGGHLGFFEKGILRPHSLTWMDRLIIEYADAITKIHQEGNLPVITSETSSSEELDDFLMVGDFKVSDKRSNDLIKNSDGNSLNPNKATGSDDSDDVGDRDGTSHQCNDKTNGFISTSK
ncbi:unnamed protein product [Lymnaea stagnalis]|uniref:AB hydrolase-1 domain-containing protein n=1 Tax=Lymnaea stagnalis TaxID=6523 RepID=A0AAV2HJ60_LYMST